MSAYSPQQLVFSYTHTHTHTHTCFSIFLTSAISCFTLALSRANLASCNVCARAGAVV